MTRKDKLIETILRNPRAVRFDDACKIACEIGFLHQSGKGSHRVFKKVGELVQLNFQNRNSFILPYQARQLIAMIQKYGNAL